MSWMESAVAAAASFGAALGGAWLAFALSKLEKKRDLRKSKVAAGNRALFALMRQFNTLHNIKTQFIDPRPDDPLRFRKHSSDASLAGLRNVYWCGDPDQSLRTCSDFGR